MTSREAVGPGLATRRTPARTYAAPSAALAPERDPLRARLVPAGNRATGIALGRASLIQRTCACGGPPGSPCHCENEDGRVALQPTLAVNTPGDSHELEADRVADQVMRMASPVEGEERPRLQRASSDAATSRFAPAIVHEVLRSPGEPLDAATRGHLEPRFGRDLGQVRVHRDAHAAESARAVNALAYTVGRDLVFGAGRYAPETAAGRRLLAHELTHVFQQGHGVVGRALLQRAPAPLCNVRRPEDCATFELWLLSFRALPTFTSEDGIPLARGGHPKRFAVLGAGPASRDPNAAADQPVAPRGPRTADRFIDHPTEAWVRRNLPENLRLTAYQLPADCADILVILRHVYLSAQHRTEQYGDWVVGEAIGRAAQSRIARVIIAASTENLEAVVNPYRGTDGRPIREFARLEPLLHPGDQLVWDHHGDGLNRRRTGGHSQTIMDIERAGTGIRRIDVLQGNEPLFEQQAREVIAELNRERAAAGGRLLPRAQAAPGGPLETSLRHAPARRIEASTLEGRRLGHDIDLPRRRGSAGPAPRAWTWGDADNTILVVAGPPRSAPRPPMQRVGGTRTPRLSDWLRPLRAASAERVHPVFEAALHETRATLDGGGTVPASDATDLGSTAGRRLWDLAKGAVRRLVAFGRGRGDVERGDLGERAHFEPLHRVRAMIRALGGIEPPTYHGNPAAAAAVRTTFRIIDIEFDFAARGGADLDFTRRVRRGRELVRVLITGFDPFDPHVTGPPPAGAWNPSGAAVMSMDGTTVSLGGGDVAAVEGVVFPVSFRQFSAGIVERVVRRAGPDVDAIISVSLDPNLASTGSVRIEQFAVGVHGEASIQPHRLLERETVAHPGLQAITPGGPPIVESNIGAGGIAAVAAATGGGIGTAVTLRFASRADAVRAAGALGVTAPPTGPDLVLSDEAVVRALMMAAAPVGMAPGAAAEIMFTAHTARFRATLVRGPGGAFLSNEVFYRIRTEIHRAARSAVSFHVHTPGGAPIPQETGTSAERTARRDALAAARAMVVTLIARLRSAIAAVGRRIIAARHASGGSP